MNIQNEIKTAFSISVVLFVVAIFTGSLCGEVVVYEPFDYAASGSGETLGDGNQNGGVGFDGAWSQDAGVGTNYHKVISPGMTFNDGSNDLPVEGGAAKRPERNDDSVAYRSLSTASTLALTADNSTMWFSVLFDRTGSNTFTTLSLATSNATHGKDATLASAGYGVAINTWNFSGNNKVRAAAYNGGTTIQKSDYNEGLLLAGNTPYLLAAKVNFKPDGTPDELFVFNITNILIESDALASTTVDIPLASQQALSVLNICGSQTTTIDEIRFGTTYEDVIGIEVDETAPHPVIAGINMITWTGRYVQLAPTVGNNDSTPLTYKWTASPSAGVVFSDDEIESPTVTITNAATSNPTTYTLTLAVNNTGRTEPDVEDTLEIDVYDDPCKAAIGKGLEADNPTDLAGDDCVTDIKDLAEFAKKWLDGGTKLEGPVAKPQ